MCLVAIWRIASLRLGMLCRTKTFGRLRRSLVERSVGHAGVHGACASDFLFRETNKKGNLFGMENKWKSISAKDAFCEFS